jgi:hypothetical protein
MYEISAMVLGIYPEADGFECVRIAPVLPPENFSAKGRIPLPEGYIDVTITRKGGEMSLDIRASREMALSVKLPGGEWENVTAKEYSSAEEA